MLYSAQGVYDPGRQNPANRSVPSYVRLPRLSPLKQF